MVWNSEYVYQKLSFTKRHFFGLHDTTTILMSNPKGHIDNKKGLPSPDRKKKSACFLYNKL